MPTACPLSVDVSYCLPACMLPGTAHAAAQGQLACLAGSNLSIWQEDKRLVLKKGMLKGRGYPPDNCTVHWVDSYDDLAHILTNEWATCVPCSLTGGDGPALLMSARQVVPVGQTLFAPGSEHLST